MNNIQLYIEELTFEKKIHDNELEKVLNSSEPYLEVRKKLKKLLKKTQKINNELSFLYEILKNNITDESIRKS